MESNIITLKSINELLGFNFFIPSFQRGFRWTNQQVNDLLNDIWEFTQKDGKPKDEFYCLQPIVITKNEEKYSIIDGQQRLTSIHIILSYLDDIMKILNKEKFTLEYDTRKDSGSFLKQIDINKQNENIDYYHICCALNTVKEWFKHKDGTTKINFLNTLLKDDEIGNNVKVIWYEINEDTDPIDIFTRINMGKIPLTNAELIKALFLLKDNFKGDDETKRLRQLEIAGEWDRMEYALRNEEFWYFLHDGVTEYDNRIEFIFDLISNKNTNDKYYTFRYFNEKFSKSKNVEIEWNKIKNYFLTFLEWFTDRDLFHLTGYLVSIGENIGKLKKECENKTKNQFKSYLINEIKKHVNCQIAELNYFEDYKQIKKVLLLFNVITLLSNKKSNIRFQFYGYKNENWDIEHIHSVQSEMPESLKHQVDWLNETLQFTKDESLKIRIGNYIENQQVNSTESFDILYSDIIKKYSENNSIEDINDISNLTLLDVGTNRGYKNAIFPVKRKKIIEKDQRGAFIPLCTKYVFLKYYNDSVEQMTFWGLKDREAYKNSIISILNPYLPDQTVIKSD